MMQVQYKAGFIERFGIYYLNRFRRNSLPLNTLPNDTTLKKEVSFIRFKGILLSGMIGLICVFPMVWFDIQYDHTPWYIHYSINAASILFFTAIEFYFLFLIALKCVHEVAELANIHTNEKEYLKEGAFSITHILSRAALEVDEPEIALFGINPFKKLSKKNLLLLGLIYKLKIILSNLVIKYLLIWLVGYKLFGISILYEALLVEFFWNAIVLDKVIREARLRIFGFVLANQITDSLSQGSLVNSLSNTAKMACLRAIGNTIVLTKNYHPNMVILLLEFEEVLKMKEPDKLDEWPLFLNDLNQLNEPERFFVLDVLCVSAAFDGKLSDLEINTLGEAFTNYDQVYFKRIHQLQYHIVHGELHAANKLCGLDFLAG